MRKLPRRLDGLTVQMHLPVFHVVPGLAVRTVAMVLHFLIKPDPFPRRPCLGTPVFFRSMHQRLHGRLVLVAAGCAADVSIGDFVRCSWQATIPQEGAVGLDRIDSGRRHPLRVFTLHGCQPRWRRWRVWLSQDREDSGGVCWGFDERGVGMLFDLLYAGGCRATGAAIQGVRFGAVSHLILQL